MAMVSRRGSVVSVLLLGVLHLAAPARAEDTTEAPAPAADVTPPPADAAPSTDSPAAPVEETAPPAEENAEAPPPADTPVDTSPPLVDPAAPLQRWLKNRNSRVDEDAPPSVAPPPRVDEPPAAPPPGTRPGIQLVLKNGQVLTGEVVDESAEGWTVKLPTGETRFFDRLDVESTSAPGKARPSLAQKAVLLASLAWPGAGQIIYGAVVQKGQVWERSAFVVGSILTVVTMASLLLAAVGAVGGAVLPLTNVGGDVLGNAWAYPFINPISMAGVLGVVLALSVGVADACARAILD